MTKRNACVEGKFYPSTKTEIFSQIREIEKTERYPLADLKTTKIFGAVLPHAGHIFSGYQTIPFFHLLQRQELFPETYVIVHPNHTGNGMSTALDPSSAWINSVGEVPVDREFADALELPFDRMAHLHEHSAEVIIPFIQYYMADRPFSIVPICLRDQSYRNAADIARRICVCGKKLGKDFMVIASCDFSHFLPPAEGMEKDQLILDCIRSRDPESMEQVVLNEGVTLCGYGPVMVLMECAASCDPGYRVEVLARGHSGEVIPSKEVVNYISMILFN
jgi:MEMO1 family protein